MEWLYGSARESAVQRIGTTVGEAWHLDALLSHDRLVSIYRSTHVDGQRATVKVIEIDGNGKMRLSRKAALRDQPALAEKEQLKVVPSGAS